VAAAAVDDELVERRQLRAAPVERTDMVNLERDAAGAATFAAAAT
jgi:hypothetical protein